MDITGKRRLFLHLIFLSLICKTDSEDVCTHDSAKGRGFDNPCCYYPCENRGVCMPKDHDYICECKGIKYFGKNCQRVTWKQWMKSMLIPSPESGLASLSGWPVLWFLVNNIGFLQDIIMKHIYLTSQELVMTPTMYNPTHDYITMDSYFNHSYYARDLPPIPRVCPTAMGFQGVIELPPVKEVIEKILIRDKFRVNMRGNNLLFAAYTQHFIHQFLKINPEEGLGVTWGNHGVDASQIYGKDKRTRIALRSFKDGKLKVQLINNEEYPPYLASIPDLYETYPPVSNFYHITLHYKTMCSVSEMTDMHYMYGLADGNVEAARELYVEKYPGRQLPCARKFTSAEIMGNDKQSMEEDLNRSWALGDPLMNRNPWLIVIAIIWLREHNRVCTILQREHPKWDDEQLYQTARLIITGEMIKITMEDYLQQLGPYNFALRYKPEVLHNTEFQYSNKIHQEFNFMHYWQALEPDSFEFHSDTYKMANFYATNSTIMTDYGLDVIIELMINTISGEIGHQNYPNSSYCPLFKILSWSREMRLQPFNNYRKAFGMQPYDSFMEMTGNPETARVLEDLYQDVNAVEFFIGMVAEKKQRTLLGQTGVIMMMSWTMKILMSHPIGSPGWWRPSTFGGKVGMNIIKTASLKSLICNNLQNKCKKMDVSFKIPYVILQDILKQIYIEEVDKFVPRKKCGLRQSKLK